ncbi:AAA family ATPase [Cohnella abietis]|uniref:AAA domain-containing protein n=1 Tax=Cohnella abietis TaxID=2507935 RepID=A0A3T1CY79_9BACL|nr:AAA family ATPase [Cohnella abietis]BBI30761.1 hypothetical protein KCTCHS21_01600 [Cohnella abietis]
MKIGIATGDINLNDMLTKIIDDYVTVWSDLDQAMKGANDTDIIILSTNLPGKVLDFMYTQGDKPIILLTDRPNQVTLRMPHLFICDIYGMMEKDITNEIINLLKSDRLAALKTRMYLKMNRSSQKSKLIVTYSPLPRQGKTTFIKNLSSFIADKNGDKKVAVVDLNLYNSDLLHAFGFEKHEIKEKKLEDFIEDTERSLLNCEVFIYKKLANLHILPHISSPYETNRFTGDVTFKLLEELKQRYDYVFIEISSHLVSNTSVISLMNADHVYVVTTAESHSLRAFERWFPEELKQKLLYNNKSVQLILNEYGKNSSGLQSNQAIEIGIGTSIVARIPHLPWVMADKVVQGALETGEVKAFLTALQDIARQLNR